MSTEFNSSADRLSTKVFAGLQKTGLTVFPIVYNTAAKPYSCKLSCTRNRAANSMLPYIQNEMAFVIIEESVFFHLSEFRRQSASLDAEVIRKLLP